MAIPNLSRSEFDKKSTPVELSSHDGLTLVLDPIEFASGSFGWCGERKVVVTLADGTAVKCRFIGTMIVIGSKPAPDDTRPSITSDRR
jgi:hypothetical protein